jgi:hypothetical protein
MSTVIERGFSGPVCGECGSVLPVAGDYNRVCLKCNPEKEIYWFDERELRVLREMMDAKEMSAKAVVRHIFRLGQMCDLFISQGYKIRFESPDGGETVDPLAGPPKMAEMPYCGNPLCHRTSGLTIHNPDCPEYEYR